MSVIRYICPSTYNEVATAIDTGHDTLFRMKKLSLKIWVWCPHCAPGHQINPSDAVLQSSTAPSDNDFAER